MAGVPGQLGRFVCVPLAAQHGQHRRMTAAHLAGDLLGAAAGGEDRPHLGFCESGERQPLPLLEATTMPRRLPLVGGPAMAAVAALQPSPLGAIAAAAHLQHGADAVADGAGAGGQTVGAAVL